MIYLSASINPHGEAKEGLTVLLAQYSAPARSRESGEREVRTAVTGLLCL